MPTRELLIAYRVCPKLAKGAFRLPGWDKEHMVRVCLGSMLSALAEVDYALTAILDDCPESYVALLRDRVPESRLCIQRFAPGEGGNDPTFQWQLNVLTDGAAAEVVYAAEDDYLFLPGAFRQMVDLMHEDGVDFVTPYDHPDYYLFAPQPGKQEFLVGLHRYESALRWAQGRHWRTVSSTTCSFMTTACALRRTLPAFRLFPVVGDYGMWLALTHKRRCHANWRETLRFYHRVPLAALLGRAWTLWSPVPTLATHMVSESLAPDVDWQEFLAGGTP